MQAYSKEMRRDVLAACDAGEGTRAVALRFNCSESWVRRVKQERRELGKVAPATTRKRTPKWERHREQIEELITSRPDMTLSELKEALGTELSRSTLCVALRRLKLTLKKSLESDGAGSRGRRESACQLERLASRSGPRPAGVH